MSDTRGNKVFIGNTFLFAPHRCGSISLKTYAQAVVDEAGGVLTLDTGGISREEFEKYSAEGKEIVVILRSPLGRYRSTLRLMAMLDASGNYVPPNKGCPIRAHSDPYMHLLEGIPFRYIDWNRLAEYMLFAGFPSQSGRSRFNEYEMPELDGITLELLEEEKLVMEGLMASNKELQPEEFKELFV